jgi:hypothetical protein
MKYFKRGIFSSVLIFAEIFLTFMSCVHCVSGYYLHWGNFSITTTLTFRSMLSPSKQSPCDFLQQAQPPCRQLNRVMKRVVWDSANSFCDFPLILSISAVLGFEKRT